jgi:hypothetical protein
MAMEDGEIGWFSPDPRGISARWVPRARASCARGAPTPRGRRRSEFEAVMRACTERREAGLDSDEILGPVALHRMGSRTRSKRGDPGRSWAVCGVHIGGAFLGVDVSPRTRCLEVALVARRPAGAPGSSCCSIRSGRPRTSSSSGRWNSERRLSGDAQTGGGETVRFGRSRPQQHRRSTNLKGRKTFVFVPFVVRHASAASVPCTAR